MLLCFLDPNTAVLQPCERPDRWCYIHFCSENFLLLPKMRTRQKLHFQGLCWIRYCALEERGYLDTILDRLLLRPLSIALYLVIVHRFHRELCINTHRLMWFSVSDLTGQLIELGNGKSWSTRVLPIQPLLVGLAMLSPKTLLSGWQAILKD